MGHPYGILRNSAGGGGPIDLTAPNGVANALGEYSYVADAEHNPTGGGLQPGVVYKVWMDIENRPFDVADGVQNGGDLYSLYIQREGDAHRTNLFQGLLSDRDAVNIDPVSWSADAESDAIIFLCEQSGRASRDKHSADGRFLSECERILIPALRCLSHRSCLAQRRRKFA